MNHPIDQLEAWRREIVAALRERIIASGIARHRLAVLAGLSDRALKNFDRADWNPKPDTIRTLDAFLDSLGTYPTTRTTIRAAPQKLKGQESEVRPRRPNRSVAA